MARLSQLPIQHRPGGDRVSIESSTRRPIIVSHPILPMNTRHARNLVEKEDSLYDARSAHQIDDEEYGDHSEAVDEDPSHTSIRETEVLADEGSTDHRTTMDR